MFVDGTPVMRLSYGDATDALSRESGLGDTRRATSRRGSCWTSSAATGPRNADGPGRCRGRRGGRQKRVVPYVRTPRTRWSCGSSRAAPVGEMASLQAAFKEAIQKQFQLEPRELACEPMPAPQTARRSSSTRRPKAAPACCGSSWRIRGSLPQLARRALEICHFDPDTLEDTAPDACGKACYECLLDYGNQPDHPAPRSVS